jgi:hypothetical protein
VFLQECPFQTLIDCSPDLPPYPPQHSRMESVAQIIAKEKEKYIQYYLHSNFILSLKCIIIILSIVYPIAITYEPIPNQSGLK